MKTVLIVNGSAEYSNLFNTLGFVVVKSIEEADLVCFTGGEDVTPSLYGDFPHYTTFNNPHRDEQERFVFNQALEMSLPMVGICRGAQFLNVMSGGRMYQHVSGHTRSHFITDVRTGEQVYVSSTHHQMMMPSSEAVLVAFSAIGGTREWYDGDVFKRDVSNTDNEVVFYEKTKCLCFQPHPEFMDEAYEGMRTYFSLLLDEYLKV